MNNHKYIWASAVIIVLFLGAWWFWRLSNTTSMQNQSSVPVETNFVTPTRTNVIQASTSIPVTGLLPTSISSTNNLTNLAAAYTAYEQGLIDKDQLRRIIITEKSKQSLDFYGKVIDQYGQPIVGAKVKGDVELDPGTGYSKSETHYVETDAEGRFSFLGFHGLGLGIWPQKRGYDYNLKLPSKRPDNYQPDPNNPAVFTMWKLKGSEPIIHDKKFYGINPDGRVFTIDLVNKKKTEGQNIAGDLLVQIQRPPQIQPRQKFDWSFVMTAIDGGVIEATETGYLNEAPESGYQPRYEISMSASDPNWQEQIEKTFYLKSRGGQVYGHFRVTIIPNYNNTSIFDIDYYVNPAGSRNLEFDPTKQIR